LSIGHLSSSRVVNVAMNQPLPTTDSDIKGDRSLSVHMVRYTVQAERLADVEAN
jgi:hypothetical protein